MQKLILTSLGMIVFALPCLSMESIEETHVLYGSKTSKLKFELNIDLYGQKITLAHLLQSSIQEEPYLKVLNIKLPTHETSISIIAPNEANEEDFEEIIRESFDHVNNPKNSNLLKKIAKKTIAYSLAAQFESALKEERKGLATSYAIAAILNKAHLIDESFLYTIYDINPKIIDDIEKKGKLEKKSSIAYNWKTGDEEIFKPTERVVERLISFQK